MGFTLSGLRYRKGRSLTVFVLAVLATVSAVVGPAYARAVEESLLQDRLRAAPVDVTGAKAAVTTTFPDGFLPGDVLPANAPLPVGTLKKYARKALPDPAYAAPIGSMQLDVTMPALRGLQPRDGTTGRLAYREDAWSHLELVSGRFPAAKDEVVVAESARRQVRIDVGATVALASERKEPAGTVRVVGLYKPRRAADPHWFNRPYFEQGVLVDRTGAEPREIDLLATWFSTEETVAARDTIPVTTAADLRLRTDRVGIADVRRLAEDERRSQPALFASVASQEDEALMESGVGSVFQSVDENRAPVRTLVPLVAAQLVLLCWFVLFLAIANATEERGPEVALAKLRGFRASGVYGFGLGESLLLVLAAAPVGLVLGLGVVELAARSLLVDGVNVELSSATLVVWALAVAGACLAALFAARRTLARPVTQLLRRVPSRGGRWRTTALEGLVLALAAAALFQLLTEAARREASPLALLAPGLIAIVMGMAVARLLPALGRRRGRRALAKGRIDALLAYTQLARRPAGRRMVVIVTVAVALFTFAVVAWDVGAQQRAMRSAAELGAAEVYSVEFVPPEQLLQAVRKAEPSGQHAMAVVRTAVGYESARTEIVAVDSSRFAAVSEWSRFAAGSPGAVARELHPPALPAITVRGPELAVDVTVASVRSRTPVLLTALVVIPDRTPLRIDLGQLTPGRHTLRARLSYCAEAGCRLTGFTARKLSGAGDEFRAQYTIAAVREAGRALDLDLDNPDAWRAPEVGTGFTPAVVKPGAGGLAVTVDARGPADPRVVRADAPEATPAVASARMAAESSAEPRFGGLYGIDQPYDIVRREEVLPRATGRSVLVDLEYADRIAAGSPDPASGAQRAEVWVGAGAPADLRAKLTAAGLRITDHDELAEHTAQFEREGPTLALRLYLFAAVAALLLGAGAVVATTYIGAAARSSELAALRLAGVPERTLSRSVLREYTVALALAAFAGVLAGAVGVAAALPSVPLFTDPPEDLTLPLLPGPWWLPIGLACVAALLGAVVALVARGLLSRAQPDRVRAAVS